MTRLTHTIRALVSATLIASTFAIVTALPASADPPCDAGGQSDAFGFIGTCTGGTSGGGTGSGGGGGNNEGGGDPRTPPTGKVWHYVQPPLGPCGDGGQLFQGYTTWGPNGPIVDPAGPDTVQCVEPTQGLGAAPGPALPSIASLREQARLAVVPGVISSDFSERFSTGAKVAFDAQVPGTLQKELDVPGYRVWLEAASSNFHWDFGDGTTGSGASTSHKYESKGSNSGDSGNHLVKVTLRVVWSGQLHVDTLGGQSLLVDQLGSIPVESSIERPIVEVWSAAVPTKRS